MKLQALLLLIAIITISLVSAQDSKILQPTSVALDKTYTVKLEPNQTQTWILKLQDQLSPSTDLFVTIQSPPNDPLQQPILSISSQGKDLQQCYSANNQFSGVCRLDASKLKPNMTITIQAECLVQCELVMYAQLNQRYLLSLDNTLFLKAPPNAAAEFEFEIQVPSELNFTQIAIYAQITDFLNATEGLEFYANVGDQKVAIPDETNYKVKGEPIFWGGEGLYFSKQDFQKGRVIKIYISLSQGMQVKLYSQVSNGNDFVIDLGYSYFDYTSSNQPKRYYLDLSGKQKQIEGKTIALGFIVYGGNPTIKVSFDVDFKNTLQGTDHFGTMNFIITQTLRKSLGFKGTIFVSITSMWNSDYFIASSLFQKNYISIKPQISYYNEALDGEIFNFFFDQTHYINSTQTNVTLNQTFDVKIGLINGSGTFGIRRCKAAEVDESPLKCVLSSTNDLSNQTTLQDFYQIPVIVKKTDEFHQMLFNYDLSSCSRFQINKNLSAFYCFFHIVAAARSGPIQYTVSLSKRKYSSLLKEGQVVRQTIFKDQYVYYRFGLSSLQDIEEVAVYITLIEGEADLLASTFDNYPEFDSKDPKMKTSSSKRILFKKNQLAKNIYISVYGMELSQYTIGVVVKRVKKLPDSNTSNSTKNNITEITKMKLHLGVTQQFILKVGQEKAFFEVSSLQEGKFIIEVVQLVGNVKMQVAKADGSIITCQESQKTNTKVSCSLNLKAGENVLATVSGLQGDQQKFVIVYYKSQNCISYSLNLPLYRELAASKGQCISYEITKASDLQLAISASIAQILHGELLSQMCINNKCKKAESSRHYQLSKAQLQATCDFSSKSVSQACKIVLNFTNNSTQTLHFSLILEQKSVDVALFDGITESVTSSELSESKAKHFYFEVNSNTTIRVFFTSFTSNVFCILAHFISQRQFINNSTNIYIPYNTRQSYKQNKGNYYQFYKYSAGTSFYPISTDTLSSICQNCMFTLSVFKLDSVNSHSLSIFQVEVSQEETTLVVGQSKIGFVQEDQIFVYQLQQPTFNDAVVSIKDLNKESFTQKDCFKISVSEADSFTPTSMFVVSKNSKKLILFITTQSKVCNYEISYSLAGGSLIQASEGRIYNFQINAKQSAYFVYNHRNNSPFKVVSILNTGQVQISVTNLQTNKTWNTLLKENPLTYPLVGDANEGELMVNTNSPVYCYNCSYMIAVSTLNGAKGQLLITKINSTIPLSVNGLIREKIKINERKVRNYTFSSITTFNISVTIIYGKIKLTVLDPDNKVYREMIVTKSQVIRVRHSKQTENYTYEFDSIFASFKINVQAETDSSFTIKASKIAISQRIFEGISSYFEVKKNQPFVMEFLNLDNPTNDNATINVLIQVIKVLNNNNSKAQPIINLEAVYSRREGTQVVELPAAKRINSQSTINIQYPLKKGDYYLNLTCDMQAVLSVLLVKESLIHLKPQSSVMMSKPGIFELYSPLKSVMIQIFSCEGDLSVEATSDYSNLQSPASKKDSDEIILQQTNYGGHYVISSTTVFGQYFIKVKNRAHQNTSLLYFLNYYYYDSKDVIPYKIIAQGSTSLTYSLNADSIVFTIEAVSIKDDYKDQIKSVAIQYYLYVDTEKSKVSKFANCRLEKSVRVFNATNVRADSVDFTVNFNDLQKSKDGIFFVGAEAIVNLEPSSSKDEHYPRQLNMIYDVIEITNSKLPVMKDHRNGISVKTIVFWILFPFALAGLALFFAIKFCIKKYRGMVPDNFVQEVGQSQQQVVQGKASKMNSNASGTFKQEIQ